MKKLAVVPNERKEEKREREDVYGKPSSTLVFCSDSELQLEKHFLLDEAASIRHSLSVYGFSCSHRTRFGSNLPSSSE